MSSSHCTGVLKNIVARYNQRGSPCFFDASKAFNLVRHDILFELVLSRGLPSVVIELLRSWYVEQKLRVEWRGVFSDQFTISNGVRQGGVLSPILFSIYTWIHYSMTTRCHRVWPPPGWELRRRNCPRVWPPPGVNILGYGLLP